MKMKKLFCLLTISVFLSGCEVKMGPSQFWDKIFRTQTDSSYYKNKSEDLIQALTADVAEYEYEPPPLPEPPVDEGSGPLPEQLVALVKLYETVAFV